MHAEATWRPIDNLRLSGGLRGDYYDFDVTARIEGVNAGTNSDSAVSPKLGAAYIINDRVEVYGNWARAFFPMTHEV